MKKKIIIGILVIVAIIIVLSMFGEEEQKKPTQIVPASGGGFVKSPKNPVLKEGDLDSWMILKGDPVVIKDGEIYKMWFHANGVPRPDGRDVHSIGYATSKDGIKWDIHPNNPVFDVGPKGSFESIAVVQPSIAKINGVYEMWYGANPMKDTDASTEGIKSLKSYIGHATSKDGINWVRPK